MPMRSMMREFVRRGHRVIVYVNDEFRDIVEETGAQCLSSNKFWLPEESESAKREAVRYRLLTLTSYYFFEK